MDSIRPEPPRRPRTEAEQAEQAEHDRLLRELYEGVAKVLLKALERVPPDAPYDPELDDPRWEARRQERRRRREAQEAGDGR